jgi:arginase family enzyme
VLLGRAHLHAPAECAGSGERRRRDSRRAVRHGRHLQGRARFGPEGIRSASHLLRRYNPSLDVPIFDLLSVIDYGDVPVVPGYIEESCRRIEEGLEPIHGAGIAR